jgi:hypothetical protein
VAWNEYAHHPSDATRGDADALLSKGNAHQRLLDAVRAVDALAASREETP